MKRGFLIKILSFMLTIVMTVTALPINAIAQTEEQVLYLKEVRLAQAETADEARADLEDDGFIFLAKNLNEGTGEDGVWLGYKTTPNPEEAIYDMRLMNMNGGFTLTSLDEVIKTQASAFAEMASDLEMLIKEFVEAYNKGFVPAKKAYKALNFFRMIEGESELVESNGLGYHLVHGGMSTGMITEMIMFCAPEFVDSIVKILTMGIQAKNESWISKLSKLGPYDDAVDYCKDEDGNIRMSEEELKRRAKQLESVLKFYSNAYTSFDKLGLVSGTFDENFNIKDATYKTPSELTADELAAKTADESRYKFYKLVYDEFAKHPYGTGSTLKDFFKKGQTATKLYPLVSVLTDGEFAAMSYGCFLEVAIGANAKAEDFDCYDEVYAEATEEIDSIYLYTGVDKALLKDDSIIGFTDSATRHMASTGELEFFENDTFGEKSWEKGIVAAKILGAIGIAVIGVTRVTIGAIMITTGIISAVVGTTVKSAVCAGVIKVCSVIGGPWTLLITVCVVAVTLLVSWLIYVIDEAIHGKVDWEENPMPEYLYDVREVGFTQKSVNEGIATDYVKRPVFSFYEAVCDENGQVVDLNARSKDSSQWIGLYVSYDVLGDDAKPIKAESFKVNTGNGDAPEGYKPLTRFSEIVAYDLNQWDDDDEVNGIYMFYKQDETAPPVKKETTYYISEVYLQKGESPAHCISLLEKSGYTPLNVNLSPEPQELVGTSKVVYTYIGYKTTTNQFNAIRDMRVVYGPNQGEIMLGGSNYSECGSNDWVTLYSTKYYGAGSPILAGGLKCVNNREDAPKGYEPVNYFGGGPAVSFNYRQRCIIDSVFFTTTEQKGIEIDTQEFFLYFLPEQSFTEGTKYIGGISYFYVNNDSLDYLNTANNTFGNYKNTLRLADYMEAKCGQGWENYYKDNGGNEALMRDYLIVRSGYHSKVDGNNLDSVVYYETYNPYRAIYNLKGTNIENSPVNFVLEGLGYASWNTLHLSSIKESLLIGKQEIFVDCNEYCIDVPMEMTGRFYVSGNPSSENTYVSSTGEMKEIQPIKVSDIVCETNFNKEETEGTQETFLYVTDVFKNNDVVAVQNNADRSSDYEYGINTFKFRIPSKVDSRKYVANVVVADELSLYRSAGGADNGISREDITDDMLYKQLSAKGATNFCGYRVGMEANYTSGYEEVNALLFGYVRSAYKRDALTDMFIYINEFSFDKPPAVMSRGNIDYSLLCEIPYNLTGYEGAPGIGVWLYGTTNSKAGDRIIDFEISDSPFMDGYETIRTKEGRSPWSLICEMLEKNMESHFLGWAQDTYEDLHHFFMDENFHGHDVYYLHIKREGDPITIQKPYIEQLYLSCFKREGEKGGMNALRNHLFDQGAEAYIDVNLNEQAGGLYLDNIIYLGYSRTESVEKAVKDIRAYHGENPAGSMTLHTGVKYTLVDDIDLNYDRGGSYIYLYSTTTGTAPIIDLRASEEKTPNGPIYTEKGPGENDIEVYEKAVTRWYTDDFSDLNEGASKVPIYLYQKKVHSGAEDGSYDEPNYGKGINKTREGADEKYLDPDGKYIAELYVMDMETLRKENGYSICYSVSKEKVFERLREMGATEIIETPFQVNSRDFNVWNDNKVYIGYSRTDDYDEAIKDIAIQVELISYLEPKETIAINKRTYNLVAEAASGVKELPKAINLLGIGDDKQVAFPKMYLYTSTTANSSPITQICIDNSTLRNGWNTVRSTNGLSAYVDVQNQAYEQYLLADKDDLDSSDKELVYTDPLFEWMDDLSAIFDPEEENVTTSFIHTKTYSTANIAEEKPYIEEIYLAAGDSREDALAHLVEFYPDEFIDIDLNLRAGGKYVYLGYKRTDKASAAIRDLMICEGANPALNHRVEVNGIRIRYDRVAEVDLNAEAGGDYLYLYYTTSDNIGNPITNICIVEGEVPTYHVKCGVEKNAVLLVEDSKFTDECIDLNEGAGGAYLYMYMLRETIAGHTLNGDNKRTEHKDATCGNDGYDLVIETCAACKKDVTIKTVISATGKHVDDPEDGDHRCDVCRKRDITSHVRGEVMIEYTVEATCKTKGSYHERIYCTDCEDLLSDKVFELEIDPFNHVDKDENGECDLCGVADLGTHTPGEITKEEYKEATCSQDGSYIEVTHCSKCGIGYQEKTVVIEATGEHVHGVTQAYDRIESTCSENGSYREVVHCSICGIAFEERMVELPFNRSNHTPGDPVVENRVEPTEDTEGSYQKVIYCSGCGEKISEEIVWIPAIGDAGPEDEQNILGSIFGEGSMVAIVSIAGVAIVSAIAIMIYQKKKKNNKNNKGGSKNE